MDNQLKPKPKAGRPAPPGGRRKTRTFRANDAEWQQIEKNAEREGLNISEYIRDKTLSEKD